MNQRMRTYAFRVLILGAALIAAGCQSFGRKPPPAPLPPPTPPIQAPVATHEFVFDPTTDDVVGQLQVTKVEGEDTLSDIARRVPTQASTPGSLAKDAKSSCPRNSSCRMRRVKA
jgi:hypothetical protein